MTREEKIQAMEKSLREFAALCPWLEQKQEVDDSGEITGTFDEESVLKGEGIMSPDFVTAGMIRRARIALRMGTRSGMSDTRCG